MVSCMEALININYSLLCHNSKSAHCNFGKFRDLGQLLLLSQHAGAIYPDQLTDFNFTVEPDSRSGFFQHHQIHLEWEPPQSKKLSLSLYSMHVVGVVGRFHLKLNINITAKLL